MDYSTLTDAELQAIANGDYSQLSDATLAAIAGDNQPVDELAQAKQAMAAKQQEAIAPIVAGAQTAYQVAQPVVANPYVQKAAELGAEAYAGKKILIDPLLKKMESMRPPAPPAPVVPTGMEATMQTLKTPEETLRAQSAANSAKAQVAQPPQMQAAKSIVQKLALDKLLKGAGVAGAALPVATGMFYTSPEEIAVLKAAEARKRRLGQ